MTYPTYREVSEDHLDLRCDITARGDCCKKNEDERVRDVGMQLVVNATDMIDGLSNQQKKVGIGVLQQWFVEVLKFFGQESVLCLLPGMFVRVVWPPAKELERYRYIGVVDSIDGDILVLLTYDEDGELHDVRIPHNQFVIERVNGYTGAADFPRFLTDHHSSTLLPLYLQVAHATLIKRQMQAKGMMEPDPIAADSESGAPPLIFGTGSEHFVDPDTEELLRTEFGFQSEADWEEIKTLQQQDASITKDVLKALSIAKAQGESEIQFIPTEYAFLVRIRRKASHFITLEEYTAEHGANMILRLKSMAKMSLDGSQVVDEGFIDRIELNDVQCRLRISTCWARGGEMALVQFIDGVVHRPCDNANPETVFAPSEIEALIEGAREGAVSDSERNADRALSSVMRSPEGDRIFSQLYQLTSQRDVVDPHTYTGEITALVGLIRHSLQAHSVGIEILHSESADIEDRVRELLGGNASITYSPPDNCSIERLFNLVRALCGGLPHASKGIGGSFVLHLPSGPIVCTVAPSIDQRGKRLVLAVTES